MQPLSHTVAAPVTYGCSPCHLRLQLARITLPCTPLLACALHAPPPPPPPTDSAAGSAAAAAVAAEAAEAARWRSMAFSTVAVASTAAVEPPPTAAVLSTAITLYAIDRHRALHVLPLGTLMGALAAAGEGAAGADAAGADTAGADGGARGGAVAGAAWWHGEGQPALRARLTTLLPCAVHALAVLPPTPGAGGGVTPAVAVLAEPDSLRMLALG